MHAEMPVLDYHQPCMENRRVVVTGMGALTPLGNSVAATWRAMLNAETSVAEITRFKHDDFPVHVACEIKNFDAASVIDPKEVRRTDAYEHFAMAAAHEAMAQSGLVVTPENADRIGVVIGSSVGGINSVISGHDTLSKHGSRRVNVFVIPMVMVNGAAGMVAIRYGAQGPSYAPASACATSNDAVGQAFQMIKRGAADAMISGGADATVVKLGMAGFDQLTALSHDNALPSTSPKPFDKDRSGLVVGEGAGVLILEELEFAKKRGATIYAEIAGYGQTNDAHHVVAPAEGGSGAARAIARAIAESGLQPDQIDYINAHGTATPLNDISETAAIKSVLGPHAYKVPVSSTKSMTGHMMGATGSIESIACILAMRDGVVPPTRNLQTADDKCDLDYVPREARAHRVNAALNNSFGFGGHNSVLLFKRYEE
jgi:3-oxoacyl-[acyl-carrier-protein] synthase II